MRPEGCEFDMLGLEHTPAETGAGPHVVIQTLQTAKPAWAAVSAPPLTGHMTWPALCFQLLPHL